MICMFGSPLVKPLLESGEIEDLLHYQTDIAKALCSALGAEVQAKGALVECRFKLSGPTTNGLTIVGCTPGAGFRAIFTMGT